MLLMKSELVAVMLAFSLKAAVETSPLAHTNSLQVPDISPFSSLTWHYCTLERIGALPGRVQSFESNFKVRVIQADRVECTYEVNCSFLAANSQYFMNKAPHFDEGTLTITDYIGFCDDFAPVFDMVLVGYGQMTAQTVTGVLAAAEYLKMDESVIKQCQHLIAEDPRSVTEYSANEMNKMHQIIKTKTKQIFDLHFELTQSKIYADELRAQIAQLEETVQLKESAQQDVELRESLLRVEVAEVRQSLQQVEEELERQFNGNGAMRATIYELGGSVDDQSAEMYDHDCIDLPMLDEVHSKIWRTMDPSTSIAFLCAARLVDIRRSTAVQSTSLGFSVSGILPHKDVLLFGFVLRLNVPHIHNIEVELVVCGVGRNQTFSTKTMKFHLDGIKLTFDKGVILVEGVEYQIIAKIECRESSAGESFWYYFDFTEKTKDEFVVRPLKHRRVSETGRIDDTGANKDKPSVSLISGLLFRAQAKRTIVG